MFEISSFTEPQAARILGVSTKTLMRWRKRGLISFHRSPGGRVSYSADQLASFRASCRVVAASDLTSPQLSSNG